MAQASAEKLKHTGPAEKERVASVPQREQLASTPEPPCQKKKEQSRQFRVPNHEVGESQGGREPHLGERGVRAGAWGGKDGLHGERGQIARRRGRASKKSLLRRNRRKHERVSGRKSSLG